MNDTVSGHDGKVRGPGPVISRRKVLGYTTVLASALLPGCDSDPVGPNQLAEVDANPEVDGDTVSGNTHGSTVEIDGDLTVSGHIQGSSTKERPTRGALDLRADAETPPDKSIRLRDSGETLIGTQEPTLGAVRLDVVGADIGIAVSDSDVDNVRKQGGLCLRHYDNSSNFPMGLIRGDLSAYNGTVRLGGGYIGLTAATRYEFYLAPNTTTRTGSTAMWLLADGLRILNGFGCNGAAAQPSAPSGGTLAPYSPGENGFDSAANVEALYDLVVAMRAALVATPAASARAQGPAPAFTASARAEHGDSQPAHEWVPHQQQPIANITNLG